MAAGFVEYFRSELKNEPFYWELSRRKLKKMMKRVSPYNITIHNDNNHPFWNIPRAERYSRQNIFSFLLRDGDYRLSWDFLRQMVKRIYCPVTKYYRFISGLVQLAPCGRGNRVFIYFYQEGLHKNNNDSSYLGRLFMTEIDFDALIGKYIIRARLASFAQIIVEAFMNIFEREMSERCRYFYRLPPTLKESCRLKISKDVLTIAEFRKLPQHFQTYFVTFYY